MQSSTSSIPEDASRSSSHAAKGRPATGRRIFGSRSVRGNIRVPRPPASTTAWSATPRVSAGTEHLDGERGDRARDRLVAREAHAEAERGELARVHARARHVAGPAPVAAGVADGG